MPINNDPERVMELSVIMAIECLAGDDFMELMSWDMGQGTLEQKPHAALVNMVKRLYERLTRCYAIVHGLHCCETQGLKELIRTLDRECREYYGGHEATQAIREIHRIKTEIPPVEDPLVHYTPISVLSTPPTNE